MLLKTISKEDNYWNKEDFYVTSILLTITLRFNYMESNSTELESNYKKIESNYIFVESKEKCV